MKSVLISIQPKWVEKICTKIGEENKKPVYKKRIEVRKGRPNEPTPIKCLIYCTYGQLLYADYPNGADSKVIKLGDYKVSGKNKIRNMLNGKVIGEFVCDRIDNYECELWNDGAYELIRQFDYDEYGEIEYKHGAENNENCEMLNKACLTWQDIRKYLGQGLNNCYAWHITDLKIYDKPKELSEFNRIIDKCVFNKDGVCQNRKQNQVILCKNLDCDCKKIVRPPQSWCYVESGVQCE